RDLRGTLLFRHGYFVTPWSRPLDSIMPVLEDCFRTCLDTGNLIYAAYVAYASGWMLFEKGEPLEAVLGHMRKYAPFAGNNRIIFATAMLRLQELFIAGLQGQEAAETATGTASAADSYAALVGTAHGYGIAFYHVVKQITPYLMGRLDEAMAAADEAAALLPKISSSVIEASHHLYGALTITARLPVVDPGERERLIPRLEEHRRKLRLWAENCPETFVSRSLLVEAEVARAGGNDDDAMRLFEEAILAARQHGQLHCEAIANERAAGLFRERGLASIAATYLRNARYCYLRWGAFAKIEQLDRLHPGLTETQAGSDRAAAIFSGCIEGLDLMTVIKAQQAVSGEIVLDKLVEALLRIVVEHAGADRGLLILRRSDLFRIEAEAFIDGDHIRVTSGSGLPETDDLPLSVLHYVTRSRERVVLDDAAALNSFMTEGYAGRTGVKSLLCLPVVTHGELSAVLYLENRLTTQAFTRNHIAVLDLLATQASISLENALLYAEMEERVADRTHDLVRSLDIVKTKSDQVSALLDNSGQGFLSFGGDLVVHPEFSQACLRFFGDSPAGHRIDSLLIADDPYTRDTARACLDEALAETDPDRRDLFLSLLPEEVTVGDRVLKAEFRPLVGS
ncbi:MAG: GAF domain-containing protein, partial [Magnetospirillum sp.]